eukprot:TRINITY_DN65_c0_g1_i3.p1 TRINITY_DN65_c0_g1~~TRINITY_DN65_c0_g1_i3.p1  ORF type:complete len:575 (-),score=165.64 TRINITY_DN65_c0_g1_i3:1111-2835(-)
MYGKQDVNHKDLFKKTESDGRKRREGAAVGLRTKKREDLLQKKRKEGEGYDAASLNQFLGSRPGDGGASSLMTAAQLADAKYLQMQEMLGRLPQLVQGVNNSDNLNVQIECTRHIRKLLSLENCPPIDEVIGSGVVPRFITFLQREDSPALQFEAAWAVTNIASGTSDHTRVVMEAGAAPIFMHLLKFAQTMDVREQAVWALGNIAGDSAQYRNWLLDNGLMEPLIELLKEAADKDSYVAILRNATWTLSNLFRGKPSPDLPKVMPGLPVIVGLMYHPDDEVLTDSCWALSYFTDGSNDRIEAALQANVAPRLLELLSSYQTNVLTPVLRTIGNIATGTEKQTEVVINGGMLPALAYLLSHPKKSIRKEAAWTLSNITAGSKQQIQAVLTSGAVEGIIRLLTNSENEVRKEAAWCVANATTGGTLEQVAFLVDQGCMPPLVDLLNNSDTKLVSVALEAVENILQAGESVPGDRTENPFARGFIELGGVVKLENLQSHANQEIYERAVHLLVNFFEADDDDDLVFSSPDAFQQQQQQGNSGQPQQFSFGVPDQNGQTGAGDQHTQGNGGNNFMFS